MLATYDNHVVVVGSSGTFYRAPVDCSSYKRLSVTVHDANHVAWWLQGTSRGVVDSLLDGGTVDVNLLKGLISTASSDVPPAGSDHAVTVQDCPQDSQHESERLWRSLWYRIREDRAELDGLNSQVRAFVATLQADLGTDKESVLSALGNLVSVLSGLAESVNRSQVRVRERVAGVYGAEKSDVVSVLGRLSEDLIADLEDRRRQAEACEGTLRSLERLYGALTEDFADVMSVERFMSRVSEVISDRSDHR